MLSVYTTETIIAAIFKDNEHRFDAWYDFITKIRPTLKVLLNSDTDYYDNDYNPVYMFQKDYDIDVVPEEVVEDSDNSYLHQVERMEVAGVSDPFAIFILDVDEDTALKVSLKYGVVCHAFTAHPHTSPIFQEGIEKSVDKKEPRAGWVEIFNGSNTIPSNHLVVIDRYLLSDDSDGIRTQDGLDNVSELLNLALPPELGVDFHVLLVFDATTINKADWTFSQLSNRLNGLKNQVKRPYNIILEAVSISHDDFNYDETHNRRILSNYYIVRADHSLKAFKDGRGVYTQTLGLDWLASKGIVTHRSSDAPSKALYKYTKETIRALKQLQKKLGDTLFSQNGNSHVSIKDIKHRIFWNVSN